MEISANEYNNPVNFYPKNTGNNINTAIEGENHLFGANVFAPEFAQAKTNPIQIQKKKRKSKRLNTTDSEYLTEETDFSQVQKPDGNFFISSKPSKIKIKLHNILKKTPLINYFFLKKKTQKIKTTVADLNNINQNVDDILNTAIPYGETNEIYQDLAQNLTQAANIIGKANKEF